MALVKANSYKVHIGQKVFKDISAFLSKNKYSSYFIICDENTLQHCLPILISYCPALASSNIIEIESGEESKSLEFCANIWTTLIENEASRDSLIINLGGGVVSDLGGFTASVYKRGIDFINIPTSLLAMADASIGGKTGIDFCGLKNCIGTFSDPQAVFVNPAFLSTLPQWHYKTGLAEIFKIAVVYDKDFWGRLPHMIEKNEEEQLIIKSITLKNEIVSKDPFDKGLRNILNFGHTIGHALETLFITSGEAILHGEAVSIGMLIESHIALQKKLISKAEYSHIQTTLLTNFELRKIDAIPVQSVVNLIRNDKKNRANKMNFSLVSKIGSCEPRVEVGESQIIKAIQHYHTLL